MAALPQVPAFPSERTHGSAVHLGLLSGLQGSGMQPQPPLEPLPQAPAEPSAAVQGLAAQVGLSANEQGSVGVVGTQPQAVPLRAQVPLCPEASVHWLGLQLGLTALPQGSPGPAVTQPQAPVMLLPQVPSEPSEP
jgi:hypothetical protein